MALSIDPDADVTAGTGRQGASAMSATPVDEGRGSAFLPDPAFVEAWARPAAEALLGADGAPDARLAGDGPLAFELSVLVAGASTSRALNREHRGRDRPTNVLSFPSGLPALALPAGEADRGGAGPAALVALGDLVLCPEVVRREAAEQGKAERAHWAHLVVHGTLHLLGHDHLDDDSAGVMEALEIRLLSSAGLPDPYDGAADEAER